MKNRKWITNIHKAQLKVFWVDQTDIGTPRPTEFFNREKLERMGMVGLYEKILTQPAR